MSQPANEETSCSKRPLYFSYLTVFMLKILFCSVLYFSCYSISYVRNLPPVNRDGFSRPRFILSLFPTVPTTNYISQPLEEVDLQHHLTSYLRLLTIKLFREFILSTKNEGRRRLNPVNSPPVFPKEIMPTSRPKNHHSSSKIRNNIF